MSNILPQDDPLRRQWHERFLSEWYAIPVEVRDRLRAGVGQLEPGEVEHFLNLPDPSVALTQWGNGPKAGTWNVNPTFVDWAQDGAPSEAEMRGETE